MPADPPDPTHDAHSLDRVEELFFAALQRPEAEREAFLQRESPDDPSCRNHLLALLKSHRQAQEAIRAPAGETANEAAADATRDAMNSPTSLVGQRIGRYVIRSLIGAGGMGMVYEAEQTEPVRRMVALKIIKWGMDTEQVLARFGAERQALAMMDHANIAQIFDAGATDSGRPYFVMELVQGKPITQHCDEHQLSTTQRLELFTLVCQAVQHAHQKGIIHRDIKPSNVLVTLRDGQAIPKIIDFGVAKATNARLAEQTVFTEFRQLIGTPEYMSPEQADMDSQGIDTRSDIYSLGVLLYELLTGTTPFDGRSLRQAGYHEIQRVIREEDPQRPSTRLSALGAKAAEIADRRLADARTLRRLLRGDLDWIVMKCLEKDRSRRYETAAGLANDVQRHLCDEAVTATPPSIAYLVRKFARRNRAAAIAGGVIALAIIGGGVTALLGMWQAMHERDLKGVALSNEQIARREADVQREAAEFREYVATVRGAGMAIAVGSSADAANALWSVPERLRGWEWQHLLAMADVSLASVYAHGERVTTTVFSPDQRTLATSSWDRRILLWDMDSLHPRALRGCAGAINALAFSPDGRMLVSGENPSAGKGALRIWDVATCQMVAEREYDSGVRCLAWSSSNRIASDAEDGSIRLWDLALPDPVLTFPAHSSAVNALAFSPDGTRLASIGEDGMLHVWDVATGRRLATRPASHEWLRALAWHPAEPRIAMSGAGGAIVIWDPDTGKDVRTLLGHKQFVWRLDFSPDGSMLASGGADCMVRVWDTGSGTLLHSLGGHRIMITALDFSPDGNMIATGDNDALIKLWDLRFAQSVPMIETGGYVTGLAFGMGDASLACGLSRGDIRLIDPFDFTLQRTIHAGGTALNRLAFDTTGRMLASPSADQSIHIWDSASGQRLQSMTGRMSPATDLRFLPGLPTLVSTSEDQTLRYWNAETGASTGSVATCRSGALAVSPRGDQIAVGCDDGTIALHAPGGEVLDTLPGRGVACYSVAFDSTGARLAAADGHGMVTLWDVQRRQALWRVSQGGVKINQLVFTPDGSRLFSGGDDQIIRVMETQRGDEVFVLRPYQGEVWSLAMSADGSCLASGHWYGHVALWCVQRPAARASAADWAVVTDLMKQSGSPVAAAQRLAALPDIDHRRRASLHRALFTWSSYLNTLAHRRVSVMLKQNMSLAQCISEIEREPSFDAPQRSVAVELARALVAEAGAGDDAAATAPATDRPGS